MYVNLSQSLLGASISRPKVLGIRHRGTCVDTACLRVVDTMPKTGARAVLFPVFSAGFPTAVDSVGLTLAQQQNRAARALNQVGSLTYARATCDVLATYAETGEAWSPQLLKAVLVAGYIGLGIWALRN